MGTTGQDIRMNILQGIPYTDGLFWTFCGFGPFDTADDARLKHIVEELQHKTELTVKKPYNSTQPWWLNTRYESMDFTHRRENITDIFTWSTPIGTVQGKRCHNHFFELPVKNEADLKIWLYVVTHMNYSLVSNGRDTSADKQFGLNWSPVQELIQFVTGLENFYFFLNDHPRLMADILAAMHSNFMKKITLGIENLREARVMYLGENTSSAATPPPYYQQYSLPHIKEYVRIAHAAGIRVIVHMCGLLKSLLDLTVETGMDGIDSVTPPPLGDAPFPLVYEKFKRNDFTITGRFNAQLWVGKSIDDIRSNIRSIVSKETLQRPFILKVTTDVMDNITVEDLKRTLEALHSVTF